MAFWICARTHPNSEKIAIKNIKNQDFDCYQPKLLERKLVKQQIKMVEQPLFPCYLFIQVTNRWTCLNSTHGISSLLMSGSSPAIVQTKVIDSLKQREDALGYIQLPKQKKFAIGDKVTIQSGPFALQQGLVERMSNKQRQQVLLALLSGKIKVLVDEQQLEAA